MPSFRVLFYGTSRYPALCYIIVLSCLLRKPICYFISENSGVSFHLFQFYFPVLFVQGYCSLPDFFYEVVVIFGTPNCVQCNLAVCVDDCSPMFVMVFLLGLYGLKCFYDIILYYGILYYIILCYIILYYII
jgi:hypothetical protein